MRHHSEDELVRSLRTVLCHLLCAHRQHPHLRLQLSLRVGNITFTTQGDFSMQLPDDKTVSATASFVDAKGNPAQVQGTPIWGTDRPDLLSVTVNPDGSATVAPVGPLGSGQVTCTGDADLGDGVVDVVLMGTVEVIAGTAVGGVINFGEPQ